MELLPTCFPCVTGMDVAVCDNCREAKIQQAENSVMETKTIIRQMMERQERISKLVREASNKLKNMERRYGNV